MTDVCESTRHQRENFPNWWLKTIIVLRIAACEGEHPDGSSVPSKGSQGHPSAPVQLRLRPSTYAVATDITTGEPFNFYCLKVKAPLREAQFCARVDRSSQSRTCPSCMTRDGPAHYNVCTYFGMPIKLFLIRVWPRPLPPFRREYGFKKISKITDDPLLSCFYDSWLIAQSVTGKLASVDKGSAFMVHSIETTISLMRSTWRLHGVLT